MDVEGPTGGQTWHSWLGAQLWRGTEFSCEVSEDLGVKKKKEKSEGLAKPVFILSSFLSLRAFPKIN